MVGLLAVAVTASKPQAMVTVSAQLLMQSISVPSMPAARAVAAATSRRGQSRRTAGEDTCTIELHTWNTPNGRKISVALEEMGLPYNVKTVNITKDQQFEPAFLKISPNNRIPAIVDPEGPGGAPI